MPNVKFIRELRMGPPKVWKTGAVVSTYPKPMLVLEGDEGGLDVIRDPVIWLNAEEFEQWVKNHKAGSGPMPPITAVQFAKTSTALADLLSDSFNPVPDRKSLPDFNKVGNVLFRVGCPFKTVVIDPITALSASILSYFSVTNPGKMADARKWASSVGEKTKQTMAAFYQLPCHVVCILHTTVNKIVNDKGEVTSMTEEPVIYSKLRDFIGALPSQFFYQNAKAVGGQSKPYLQTVPDSKVRGIGCRWPAGLASEIGVTFQDVYGKSVKDGEVQV